MASDPRTTIDWHWPRSRRGLIWGLADAPARSRLQVAAISEEGRRVVAETVRGARLLLVGLGTEAPSGIEVISRPPEASKVSISFVDGPTLRPSLRDASSVEVEWAAGSWHQVRARAIFWEPATVTGPPPATVAASEGRWRLPEGYPCPGPMEVVLTPFDAKGRQGPTDSLIVPPRAGRVEVRFRHVQISQPGRSEPLLRLRVEAQAFEPAQWPRAAMVRWEPLDGCETQEIPLPRSSGRGLAELLLSSASPQGDRVSVRFEPAATGVEYLYLVESIGQNSQAGDVVVLSRGVDRLESPAYEFAPVLPPGEEMFLLSSPEPMDSIPSLVERAGETTLGQSPGADSILTTLPPAVLSGLVAVQANSWAWNRALAILGDRNGTAPLADYLGRPQYYHQLVDQPDFATIAVRWGRAVGSPPTAVHQLLHAWQARRGQAPDPQAAATFQKYLADNSDNELDRWLRLMSAGVSPEILREFLCVRHWADSDGAILRASLLLDKFRRQPTSDLLPELIPGTVPHRLAADAVRAEEAAASPGGDYGSFSQAQAARSAAIEALNRHLSSIERDGGELATRLRPALRDLGRDLTKPPAALFRRERETAAREPVDDSEPSSPPTLRFEEVLAERRRLDRLARDHLLRQVADWILRLFTGRARPPWPWSGTLTSDDPESAVASVWGRVRDQVLALPDDAIPPAEALELAEVLGKVRSAAVGAGFSQLGASISELVDNAGRLTAWLDEARARSLLKATLIEGAARLRTPHARDLAQSEIEAARVLIGDLNAPLPALAARARPVRILIEDEAIWSRDLAQAGASSWPILTRLAARNIEEARTRLADPSLETDLAAGEELAWIRAEGLDRLATRLGRTGPTRPKFPGPADSSATILYPEESARLGRVLAADARLSACRSWASARERAIRDAWDQASDRASAARLRDDRNVDAELSRWFEDRLAAGDWDDLARAQDHLGRLSERLTKTGWLLLAADFNPEVSLPRLLAEPAFRPEPGKIGNAELHDRLAAIAQAVGSVAYLVGEPEAAAVDKAIASLRDEVGPIRTAVVELYQFLWRKGIERFDTLARHDWKGTRPPEPKAPSELTLALDWLDAFRSRPHTSPADAELAEALRDVGLLPRNGLN